MLGRPVCPPVAVFLLPCSGSATLWVIASLWTATGLYAAPLKRASIARLETQVSPSYFVIHCGQIKTQPDICSWEVLECWGVCSYKGSRLCLYSVIGFSGSSGSGDSGLQGAPAGEGSVLCRSATWRQEPQRGSRVSHDEHLISARSRHSRAQSFTYCFSFLHVLELSERVFLFGLSLCLSMFIMLTCGNLKLVITCNFQISTSSDLTACNNCYIIKSPQLSYIRIQHYVWTSVILWLILAEWNVKPFCHNVIHCGRAVKVRMHSCVWRRGVNADWAVRMCCSTVSTPMPWSTCSCWTAPLTPQELPHRPSPSAPTWPPSPVSNAPVLFNTACSDLSNEGFFVFAWLLSGPQAVTLTQNGGRQLPWWLLTGCREMM